jgi:small subunit ribosomal protein S4
MEKKSSLVSHEQSSKKTEQSSKRLRGMSNYGRQLREKQKVKMIYGMRERQFERFFALAVKSKKATGEHLLSLLECRLDNAVYRLKFASSRAQARQIIVHGHVLVNGAKVYTPSYFIKVQDVISFASNVEQKERFCELVIGKRLATAVKVPEWLELDKNNRKGRVLRMPVRTDIQAPIEEQLIVELYSR